MTASLCELTGPASDSTLVNDSPQDPASAAELNSQIPFVGPRKSLMLSQAMSEFKRRRASGETIRPSTFCDQYPGYRFSLRKMFAVKGYLQFNPDHMQRIEEELRWPKPGETFLGFELLEELGKGSFACVYLARQAELGGRLVALKVAKHGAGEAETLGRLSHDNIVPVHSIHQDPANGFTAVCMAYLGRATLCDLLDAAFVARQAPAGDEIIRRVAQDAQAPAATAGCPAGESTAYERRTYAEGAVNLVRQLAEALAYTHGQGILHRDLKPSNVLLAPGGTPLLVDFNLSVDAGDISAAVGGTLPYMSPELLRWMLAETRDPAGINSPRTDIFSLGVILYEMLTGVVPFGDPEPTLQTNEAIKAVLSKQATGIPAAARRNSQVDPALDQIIARCLAADPAQRYSTAAELASELRRYLAPRQRRARWMRRQRRAILAGGAATFVLAAGLGTWLAIREASRLPDVPGLSDLERGFVDYERNDLTAAIASFDRHLDRHPSDAQALFARGQARRKLGDLTAAEGDYIRAAEYADAGIIRACVGYCLNQRKEHTLAVHWYEEAIKDHYDTAVVRNNLGYSFCQKEEFGAAKAHLDRAVQSDPQLGAARHNRAQVDLKLSEKEGRLPSAQALEDIERALEMSPPSGVLMADAAHLYALCATGNPELHDRCRQLLIEAIRLGMSKTQAESIPAFSGLLADPEVQKVLLRPLAADAPKAAEMVAPLPLEVRLEK